MVMVHEYAFNHMEHEMFNTFMRVVSPHWQKISRTMVKEDCMSVYSIEKKKLKNVMKSLEMVSVTTDMWKSGQDIEYMVVTGHFVHEWKLHKRILNFIHLPPPHCGVAIADALYKCFVEWEIDDKIASITVDNAGYNDVAVRTLKSTFALKEKLIFDGKFLHVRCTAHIMNLVVQDGLKEIGDIILNLRRSVKYLSNSEARLNKFSEIAKDCKLNSKKLILDCDTRWNSTFAMLDCALEFKEVFKRYKERDSGYQFLPTNEEWEKLEVVCQFLGVFNEVTKVISGSEYPTSNQLLTEIWRVKEVLNEKLVDSRKFVETMATSMNTKFDKYWSECNLLMAIGAVLDPRYKLVLVKFSFSEIYLEDEAGEYLKIIKNALKEIYEEYVKIYTRNASSTAENTDSRSSSTGTSRTIAKRVVSGKSRYDTFVRGVDSIQPVKSDLDIYLEEGVFIVNESDEVYFDPLVWWKDNNLKFKILSKMACDILAIPITTVASESAFSAGGRVIDPYRASLRVDTVQALMCGGDWIRNTRGIKKKIQNPLKGMIDIDLPQ